MTDRLGVGDAMTLDLLSEESYLWAIEYLTAKPDVVRGDPPRCGADDIGEDAKGDAMSNPFEVQATSGGGGDFESVPAGMYPGVLVALLDIGTYSESYMGGPPKDKRKALLVWEVQTAEKRMYIGRDYTLDFGEKANLRKLLQGWRGRPYAVDEKVDLRAVVGKPCLVNVVTKTAKTSGNEYGVVENVMQMMPGMTPITPTHPTVLWSIASGEPLPAAPWMPYVKGRPLAEFMKQSKERGGQPAASSAPLAADPSYATPPQQAAPQQQTPPASGPTNAVPF